MAKRKHPMLKVLPHFDVTVQEYLLTQLPKNWAQFYERVLKDVPFVQTPHGKVAHVLLDQKAANLTAALNVHNRPLNHERSTAMLDDLETLGVVKASSGWDFITFLETGALADGQHRLQAIAHWEGEPVPVSIRYGAPASVIDFIDRGRARSDRDQKTMRHLMIRARKLAA